MPMFMPVIVMSEPPTVGALSSARKVTTGASKLNAPMSVPEYVLGVGPMAMLADVPLPCELEQTTMLLFSQNTVEQGSMSRESPICPWCGMYGLLGPKL